MTWSKEERAAYMKKWREENKAHIKKYRHEYYVKSILNGKYKSPAPEYLLKNTLNWRKNHPEKYREYQRKYQSERRRKIALDKQAQI